MRRTDGRRINREEDRFSPASSSLSESSRDKPSAASACVSALDEAVLLMSGVALSGLRLAGLDPTKKVIPRKQRGTSGPMVTILIYTT